jgi:hypothetical protein
MNDDAGREMAVFTEAIKIPLRDHDAFPDIACNGDENLQARHFSRRAIELGSSWKTR